jgi:transcriptional regulator with XRE-family HTH domain/tetratricopeptide (TPR) repeat protein
MDTRPEQRTAGRAPDHAFGTLLRRYRLAAGLTQEALAERAGVGVRSISALEREGPHAPRADTVQRLAEALALTQAERLRLVEAARRLGAPPAATPSPAPTSSPLFVGRAGELNLLERHLGGEGPPLLLLAGEPGIGKTRLLHAAAPRAVGHGLVVLEGGCQRRGGQEPYAPLLAALEGYIRRQTPAQQRAALRGCAWLVRLLPELADAPIEPLPAWTLPPGQERRLMFEAVVRFLTNVAEQGMGAGTLLLLDDLQWAGPDALDLLSTLAHAAADSGLRLVGAYRDTEVSLQDPLPVTLADLAHAGLATRHARGPLTTDEAGQLLDQLLEPDSQAEAERVARRNRLVHLTGGVPFFLISYARTVRGNTDGWGAGQAIPWTVTQTIQQRVAALPEGAREMLGVAAVIGRVVEPALLTAVTRRAETEVLAALETASRTRLLQEEKRAYRFAHDVIREVVEADLGVARRIAIYRRVAETLEQEPPDQLPLERLTYYFTQSDLPDKAALYLEQAGDQARRGYANAVAEAHYRNAVEYLDQLGMRSDAARVREKQGTLLLLMGHYTGALDALERAAETLDALGDGEGLRRVTAQIGNALGAKWQLVEGVTRLQPLLESREERRPTHGLAALFLSFCELLQMQGRLRESVPAAARAADIARTLGDDALLAQAQFMRGRALLWLGGHNEEGLPVVQEAGRLAEATGHLEVRGWTLLLEALLREHRGEFDAGRLCAGHARTIAVRLGNSALLAHSVQRLGAQAFFAGDWAQADAYFTSMQSPERTPEDAMPLLELGRLRLAQGAWDQATGYLQECSAIFRAIGLHTVNRVAESLLAERDLLQGHPEAALARLLPLLDQDSGWGFVVLTHVLPVLAWAYLERGDVDQAARVVTDAIERARAEQHRLSLVDALRIQAMVVLRQGHWAEASQALEEGLALAQRIGYPYAEARLQQVYGQMHAQRGDRAAARERLDAALVIFRRLGARKDIERAEALLARLG